ncbi:MAG: DUF1294 domain-containing protein [Planctomycetota bacterium]|jgi:uncharacterized membrane protein YsdA (DUF1294 family)
MSLPGAALPWVAGSYGVVSIATYAAYAIDKRRATTGRRRIPEARLHLLELLGGWPGALLARRYVRHKTRKRRYTLVLCGIVLLHLLAIGVWIATAVHG